jgi:hypothetical protein
MVPMREFPAMVKNSSAIHARRCSATELARHSMTYERMKTWSNWLQKNAYAHNEHFWERRDS